MGVPKFYRWISERYPCLSEVVTEYQIPDFDNLYLDMNGIIHPCSHPNDDDPHFRITEDQIFANVCHYIEFLFKMIKPKKVFFMAVDGVAPRAKMNQQRGRRFRTAKTASILEEQALACGESLPTDAKFDSNCITPGTPFMARLHKCLQDFVVYKISSDNLWQGVRVYLSGHETPGEGEHKVMDFIRYEKSQPGYNPNTRHCLYGLDADLIMLGLCSHEPHFCLLREEVKFGGKKNQKRILTPEETTFHLLHISLLRDYLYHEFSPIKNKLSFTYDVENVIDDFVLMSFLVGNDFIPHLPQLHIHHDALPVLFQTYIASLPSLGGYINEGGYLNLERFEVYLTKLAEHDFQKFCELNDDFTYLEGKSKSHEKENDKNSTSNLLSELGFSNLAISKTAEYDSPSEDENSDEESTLELEFNMHKTDYYMNKLEFDEVTPDVLKEQAEGYVRAIQWNLHYYYNGVVSWSWYYPHHYSPYISDIKNFKDMQMEFEIGKPFLPFQQLLSVLPKLSKELLPESYQRLMCDKDSPLYDCYPDDFLTDLNGKQQEWEAIVLIPFINEKLLLKCAAIADKDLTPEEKQRNCHGPHLLYTYNSKISNGPFSFLPNHYHSISDTHAEVKAIEPNFFRLSPKSIVKGLCKGVVLDRFILGFPTLNTLKHSAKLQNEKVKVFNMVSMKDNMMLTIEEATDFDFKKLAEELIGKTVYVAWPHLREALVVAVSDGRVKYDYERGRHANAPLVAIKELTKDQQKIWARQCESIQEQSYQRWGIFTGEINVLVFAKCFSGVKYNLLNVANVQEEKQFDGSLVYYSAQTVVWKKEPFLLDYSAVKSVNDIFSIGSVVFLLTSEFYGSKGRISNNDIKKNKGCVTVDVELITEPDLMPIILNQERFQEERFMPGYVAAQQLGVDSHFFSRVTGTLLVQTSPKESSSPNRVNIGLNLKFNRKNEEVQGFTKKKDNSWLYSNEAVDILNAYFTNFADFFEKLYRFVDKDVIYIEDLYPLDEGTEMINQMTAWLKEQTCSLAERQECGMNKLDSGIINAIDNVVQNFATDVYHAKRSVEPNLLYNPLLSKGKFIPEQKQSFHLFDRVLNIRPSSSVPLGLKGTIVGIQKAEKDSDFIYEILFDKEFIGGMAICPGSKKGYRLPPDAIINLTHGIKMQKQNTSSPVRSGRVITPKLNRTQLFDAAVKQSLTQNSPKTNYQSPNQGKPFYPPDTSEPHSQYNQLPNSTYSNMKFSNSNNQHFVTPNANQFNRAASGGNSNSPVRPENLQSDFQNFWTNLKKRTPEVQPPFNTNLTNATSFQSPSEQTYGQKLSVEELFQSAQPRRVINESQNIQIASNEIPLHQLGAQDMLRQACLELFKQPPIYTYKNHGVTNFCAATIKLPNGEFVSGVPSASKVEAAVNAAEKSLAVLKTSFLAKVFPPNAQLFRPAVSPNYQANPRPILLPPPPRIPQPPVGFVPPPNIYQPPPNIYHPPPPVYPQFSPQTFQGNIMRHPASSYQSVPDSFIQANKPLVLSGSSYPPQQENFVRTLEANQNQTAPQNDVFHIPGGGTAMIKSHQMAQKGNDSAFSSMFVPAQVMKQTAKNDRALSTSDWPNLPVKQTNTPEQPVAGTPPAENILKSFSDVSKIISESTPVKTENLENAPHPTNMTVVNKKIPRKRIAANFQFS